MDSPVEGAGFKLPVPRKKGEGFETAFRVAARSNNKNGPDADRSVQGALPLPRQLRGRRHPSFDDIGDRARDRRLRIILRDLLNRDCRLQPSEQLDQLQRFVKPGVVKVRASSNLKVWEMGRWNVRYSAD